MNTAGTAGFRPMSRASAFSISFPQGSSSSSTTVGFAPRSRRRLVIVWHMQQELMPKITTARCPASFVTCSIRLPRSSVLVLESFDFELCSLALELGIGRLAYIAMEMCTDRMIFEQFDPKKGDTGVFG
uniref:Uncharacterized protein n=1 Tax=Triticum urartu TaxID=4572 RepID=A0A8R7UDW6_TRIUA